MWKLSERLDYILNSVNITKAELARIIGVQPQVVSDVLSERRGMPERCYLAIINEWPHVSYEWLRLGTNTQPVFQRRNPLPLKEAKIKEKPKKLDDRITEHEQRLDNIEKMLQEILNHFKQENLEKIQHEKLSKIKAIGH